MTRFASSIPHSETFHNKRYIAVESEFHIAPTVPIHDCEVRVNQETFLVSGYYDDRCLRNDALRKVNNIITWRGEIAVFSVGTVVPFRQRPLSTANVNKAVSRYVS